MLWYAKRVGVNLRTLTAAKAECAALVLHLMSDERSRDAVAMAKKYGRGEATNEELADADAAAAAAAYYADAAAAAAYAAAAYAAAADAAYAAAYVAYAAAYAAAYVAYADAYAARQETLATCAEIVRRIITLEMLESAQVA